MSISRPNYPTIAQTVGRTPLVRLQRIPGAGNTERNNIILGKLEGNNPAGSVKDRPALSMFMRAEQRGDIKPGDTLIEATSGNTGIALAMVAAILGYKIILVMPENQSVERRQSMAAYGAELVLTPASGGMEYARDYALQLQKEGKGKVLDQFGNKDNPLAHIESTGPEIWEDTKGQITHFVSDNKLSCIRAPPVALMQMKGTFCSRAVWAPRTKRSPTTEPIDPPMNSNSKQATTTGIV